jgi:hypothetical protein
MTAENWYKIQFLYSSCRTMLSVVRRQVEDSWIATAVRRGQSDKTGAITPLRLESAQPDSR